MAEIFAKTPKQFCRQFLQSITLLMGLFVNKGEMARELYALSNAFPGHMRGGIAMATVAACGGFLAICGSSLATAATMSKVAMP